MPRESNGSLHGAEPDGALDLPFEVLRHFLEEHVAEIVVAHLEHLGRGPLTVGVSLAEVMVYFDSHRVNHPRSLGAGSSAVIKSRQPS